MDKLDYKKLGLKCGLEIHQQLNSNTKLFCRCPNELQGNKNPDFTLKRLMRPVLGEMGVYDKAMLTEYLKGISIIYEGYNDSICTYEIDETPPFSCNNEAINIAIKIALLLNSNIIEEMHVCRKNYLDGSVPCGFQRTMILAKDGYLELEKGKKIGIDILCLEEDAARKIKTENKINYFRLDRLGIPLVEIATKPDINDPLECRETAERLGLLLWSTNVKKVLGSIRQDVNVSIKEGTRVEIKGVQKLDWIPVLIEHEISRQSKLINIKNELKAKELKKDNIFNKSMDLTKPLAKTNSKFISKGIKSGKILHGINIRGFKGIFGTELAEDYRFGTEVSSKVKSISGLKGIIHSDEDLNKYKFSESDIKKIKELLDHEEDDCFILILGNKNEIEKATDVIINRIQYAFEGVPPETRKAIDNGNTEFIRELHGGARLYPDTDSQAIINSEEKINEIKKSLPEYPWNIIKDYSEKYKVEDQKIKDLIFTGNLDIFNELLKIYPKNPVLIITTLLDTSTALRRDGKKINNILEKDYKEIFNLLSRKEIGKEAIEEFMILKSNKPHLTIDQIKKELNIQSISVEELNKIIQKILDNLIDLIKEKEMNAMGPLMGELMKEVRGKIDGKVISEELKKNLTKKLEEINK
ncbi:MAG: Glu-tRNA(Gln) amidotransferase subunit GatE [Candidatus Lokiarchaeota archaeon]|nr:Glu-tRNA(Gln) amidotransferase subunit GatE [Candidatus Lokiarchaeota archaeon]